ncbi:MAG: hypothetical protein K2X43_20850 [Hyphomonadaceae bacterium]|jgi:hypothetical protein|nr:hypothetical protein [Hyphomonadaceae bacterium]
MQCPVCHGQAQNLTPNTLDGVVISCALCGDYRIAGNAFHDFMRLKAEKRAAALQAAKQTSHSGWPTIYAAAVAPRPAPPRRVQ